jgi:hypothetical protein
MGETITFRAIINWRETTIWGKMINLGRTNNWRGALSCVDVLVAAGGINIQVQPLYLEYNILEVREPLNRCVKTLEEKLAQI